MSELQELKEEKQERRIKQLRIQLEVINNLSKNIEYYINAFDIKNDIYLDIDSYCLEGYSLAECSNKRALYKYIPVNNRWGKAKYFKELIVEWWEDHTTFTDKHTDEEVEKLNKFFKNENILDIQHFNNKLVEMVKEKYIAMNDKEENEAIEMIAMRSLA